MTLKSFYLQNEIVTGLYTAGGQWQLEDGTEYIGPYHQYILDNLTYTNARFQKGVSKQLFPLIRNIDIIHYNKSSGNQSKIWMIPKYHMPIITDEYITQGWLPRYFVQKRNSPSDTIVEISETQFNDIGTPVNGIDDTTYASTNIRWKITGSPTDIVNTNRRNIVLANQTFTGLVNYLTDLQEFSYR